MTPALEAGAAGSTWPALGRLAQRLARLKGWRRLAAAGGCGLLAATALAPLWLLPLLVPAFVGLCWLLDGAARGRTAFAVGWAFGAGYFFGGLYWVGIAMTIDFARFWWFMPISVGGLSFGLALLIGAATWIAWRCAPAGAARLLFLGAAWLLMEWLRSWVMTGFPWNLLGTVWAFAPLPMQSASLVGVWGLSLATLLAAAAPALLGTAGIGRREALLTLAVSWLLLASLMLYGALRLAAAPAPGEAVVPGVTLRLVQPSVEQSVKWEASLRTRHVQQLIDLTQGPGYAQVTHIVWPETSVPYDLSQDDSLRSILAQLVPRGGLLIAGAPRFAQGEGAWNSLYAIDAAGEVVAVYDKAHLVPFGEYVPFREILGALAIPVTQGSFEAGPGLVSLALPGLPAAAPLICYEIIFSGEVIAREGERPGFLLNLTNDAWFGRSSGPFQHFAQARLRAVEEGLPLVRAANNGVSAIVDAYGRVLGKLPLDAVGVLDGNLPSSLETSTVYAVMGDLILVPLSMVPAILGVLLVRRNRQDRRMSDNR